MKFFGTYGCSAADSVYNIAIDATDMEVALKFCYDSAVEDRDSYKGMGYGIQSWEEIAEEEGFLLGEMSPSQECYIDDLYNKTIENDIVYSVAPFNIDNEKHLETLIEQEGVFWEA